MKTNFFKTNFAILGLALSLFSVVVSGCDSSATQDNGGGGGGTQTSTGGSGGGGGIVTASNYLIAYLDGSTGPYKCATLNGIYALRMDCENTTSGQYAPDSLVKTANNYWSINYLGNGTAVINLQSDDRQYLSISDGFNGSTPEYRMAVQFVAHPSYIDPSFIDKKFYLHKIGTGYYGEDLFAIESAYAPGYYAEPSGTGISANGIRFVSADEPAHAYGWSFFHK